MGNNSGKKPVDKNRRGRKINDKKRKEDKGWTKH